MNPARIEDADTSLPAPPDWDETTHGPCTALAVRFDVIEGVPFMVSAWEVNGDEALTVLAGGKVHLGISGNRHPVVRMAVQPPPDQPWPVSTVREMLDRNGDHCVEVVTMWPPLPGSTKAHRGLCQARVQEGGVPMAVGLAFQELAKLAKKNRWVE